MLDDLMFELIDLTRLAKLLILCCCVVVGVDTLRERGGRERERDRFNSFDSLLMELSTKRKML